MKQSLLNRFLEKYIQGDFLEALQLMFTSPNFCFDDFSDQNMAFQYLLNYADASVFISQHDAARVHQTQLVKVLRSIISENPQEDKQLILFLAMMYYESFLTHSQAIDPNFLSAITDFPLEIKTLASLNKFQYPFMKEAIETLNKEVFQRYQPLIKKKVKLKENFLALQQNKPQLIEYLISFNPPYGPQIPWQLFAYKTPLKTKIIGHDESTPLIFLDPLENVNYAELLTSYQNKLAIFVIQPGTHFYQLLQFKDILEALSEPLHYLYFLEAPLNRQFNDQQFPWGEKHTFQCILTTPNDELEKFLPSLTQALSNCLEQNKNETTSASNILHQIAKNLIFNLAALRYGPKHYPALKSKDTLLDWNNPQKISSTNTHLGPPRIDYLMNTLLSLNNARQPRPRNKNQKKLKIAHIAAQLIDGGHAPTKLLSTLITHCNFQNFDVNVIITERLLRSALEYPISNLIAQDSFLTGAKTIRTFQDLGVSLFINPEPLTFLDTAKQIVELLKEKEIDIAIFHGPDEVHDFIGALTDVPLRVLFDHGTLPDYPSYDLFLSSTATPSKKIKTVPLHFAYNPTGTWEPDPYPKEKLNLPNDCFAMTTISNHLEDRLSTEMCAAIDEILEKCPNVYYAPIGVLQDKEKFISRFTHPQRVIPIGSVSNPSQCARSMDLFLNEFPFGSGLAILDAMASGCPVVSMYNENGPPQAKYGGIYFGIDHTASSKSDYVNLACNLINNPSLHSTWSNHAKSQFKKFSDVKSYVHHFEAALLNAF